MPETNDQTNSPQGRATGCLARLFWMILGNVCLLGCAKAISDRGAHALTPADLVFWTFVAALIGVRYVDIKRLEGLTAAGNPATITHWRRYVLFILVFSAIIWGSAHAIALL